MVERFDREDTVDKHPADTNLPSQQKLPVGVVSEIAIPPLVVAKKIHSMKASQWSPAWDWSNFAVAAAVEP